MSDSPGRLTNHPSLEEVNRSVKISSRHWWRRLLAFVGPAYMVAVGYMDPGNWATDIQGGSTFGYTLLWILLMANAMAVLLQTLSARLGIVTGHDLAQACRDDYPPFMRYVLFVLTEIAIAATDLAEVLGSAVGMKLLFGIPMLYGVLITGFDVFLLLMLQRLGIRKMEAFIVALISTIGVCFIIEMFLTKPSPSEAALGLIPHPLSPEQLYIAIGILGATVMPHNLYLHSSLVQSRDVGRSRLSVAQACKYNLIDSVVAMNGALLINAAILIMAAATFYQKEVVTDLAQASELLESLLGSDLARIAFGVALLSAGQSSTITGTLAGQITMEGFLNFRMRAWLRRIFTRALAITPAVIVIIIAGEGWVLNLLILSQVILSLQLPFAVVPLVKFTSSKQKMGPFASPRWVIVLAWVASTIIISLNVTLLYDTMGSWASALGPYGWVLLVTLVPMAAALLGLLVWMIFRRERAEHNYKLVDVDQIVSTAALMQKKFCRIGVALEAKPTDAPMLAEAIALARVHQAQLYLMHVVEGVGGQWYGPQTGDLESRQDEAFLQSIVDRLRSDPATADLPGIQAVIGFGDVPRQIVQLCQKHEIGLLVAGGHGHRGLADVLHGTTIGQVRHGLGIPILAVRQ